MQWTLSPSYGRYKLVAVGPGGVRVRFGARGFSDYTTHGDPRRKARYWARHAPREDWMDLTTAGAWSRWILWNKPTLHESVMDMENRFGISIKLRASPGRSRARAVRCR